MKITKGLAVNRQDVFGAFLVSLPILMYWAYWTLHPSYWFNIDPAAVYFIDSLAVFDGKSYVFVDHPGTPVHVIGSLLLAVTYPFFENRETFIHFFLSRPNAFFLMAHIFLLVANIFCAIIFYKTIANSLTKHRTLAALAISLLFFTIHPQSYQYLNFWSHNAFNYPFGTLLFVWVYRELNQPQAIQYLRLTGMGIAFGIYATIQIYFFAWPAALIMIIFLYFQRSGSNLRQTIKQTTYAGLGVMIGVIVMLIPIYKEIPRLFNWLVNVASHTGAYGTGESGFISLPAMQNNILFWWAFIRPLILTLILCIMALGYLAFWNKKNHKRFNPSEFAMTAGLLFNIGLLVFVMAKASVQVRYSLPLAAVLPVLVLVFIRRLEVTSLQFEKPLIAFYILILAGVVFLLTGQKAGIDEKFMVERIAQNGKSQAVKKLANTVSKKENEVAVVYAYGVPLKCAGLLQGYNWTGHFRDEIAKICPNQSAVWETMTNPNTAIPVKDITSIPWDLVIWPGNGSGLDQHLYENGAVNVPRHWHVEYARWYFIHSDLITE